MALICYIIATIIFGAAWLQDGIGTDVANMTLLGLAVFALGHCFGGDLPITIRRS